MKKAISYMACSMAAMLALSACGSAALVCKYRGKLF